ncbi:hypothetical protein evm_002107 [Chilo suppressalis]|nr:hypothetical protein evm_002107 [Chilo suppressalis]
MYNISSVMGCESRRKDIAFYKIPKSETPWLKCLKLQHLQNFNSVQLDNSTPTLFTDSEIKNAVSDETGKVSSAAEVLMDHDYLRKRMHQDYHSLFYLLQNCEETDEIHHKLVETIFFDEVAFESWVNYNRHKDVINGFVHLDERMNEYADHALVFILRGAVHK